MLNIIEKGFTVFVSKPEYMNSEDVDKYWLNKSASKSKTKTEPKTDVGIQFKFKFDKKGTDKYEDYINFCFKAYIKDCGYINDVHKAYDECETGIWWNVFERVVSELDIAAADIWIDDFEPEDIIDYLYNPPKIEEEDLEDYEPEDLKIMQNAYRHKRILLNVHFNEKIVDEFNLLNLAASKELLNSNYTLNFQYKDINCYVPVIQNHILGTDSGIALFRSLEEIDDFLYSMIIIGFNLVVPNTKYAGIDLYLTRFNCVTIDELIRLNPSGYIDINTDETTEYMVPLSCIDKIIDEYKPDAGTVELVNKISDADTDILACIRMARELDSNLKYPDNVYKHFLDVIEY